MLKNSNHDIIRVRKEIEKDLKEAIMAKMWYQINDKIYKELNKNKGNTRYDYIKYPSLNDFINEAINNPEDFTPEMKTELIVTSIAKALHLMGLPKYPANASEKEKAAFKHIIYNDVSAYYNFKYLNSLSNVTESFYFIANSSYIFSTDKKKIPGDIEGIFNSLELAKKLPEFKDVVKNFPKELFFKNVNIDNLHEEISVKNGLIKLAKYFPEFGNDVIDIKNKFVQKVLSNMKLMFTLESECLKAISFLNEVYDEKAAELVNKYVMSVAKYSYLKFKPSINKLVKVYPEAQPLFNSFINYKSNVINENYFLSEEDEPMYISLNLDLLEVKLWKELKKSKFELSNILNSASEFWKNKGKQNKEIHSFVYYSASSCVSSDSKTIFRMFFTFPKEAINSLSMEEHKKFIEKTLIDFTGIKNMNSKDYPINEKFDEFVMKEDLKKNEIIAKSRPVHKF